MTRQLTRCAVLLLCDASAGRRVVAHLVTNLVSYLRHHSCSLKGSQGPHLIELNEHTRVCLWLTKEAHQTAPTMVAVLVTTGIAIYVQDSWSFKLFSHVNQLTSGVSHSLSRHRPALATVTGCHGGGMVFHVPFGWRIICQPSSWTLWWWASHSDARSL